MNSAIVATQLVLFILLFARKRLYEPLILYLSIPAFFALAIRCIDPSGVMLFAGTGINNLLHNFISFSLLEASFAFVLSQTNALMMLKHGRNYQQPDSAILFRWSTLLYAVLCHACVLGLDLYQVTTERFDTWCLVLISTLFSSVSMLFICGTLTVFHLLWTTSRHFLVQIRSPSPPPARVVSPSAPTVVKRDDLIRSLATIRTAAPSYETTAQSLRALLRFLFRINVMASILYASAVGFSLSVSIRRLTTKVDSPILNPEQYHFRQHVLHYTQLLGFSVLLLVLWFRPSPAGHRRMIFAIRSAGST